jgi:colanic acid biosynthesis glycosyl transferase WcaI
MRDAVRLAALRSDDVATAAKLHQVAFPRFFLSGLGEEFLRQFYCGFIADSTAVTVVARDGNGALRGVAVGTTDPQGFFARLLRRRWLGFLLASARAVLCQPAAAPRLLRAIRYRGGTADGSGALLSSICVDPAAQGQGVGGILLEGWTREASERGASVAFLTTDAVANETVNTFYLRQGWLVDGRFETREGRPMVRYRRELGGA